MINLIIVNAKYVISTFYFEEHFLQYVMQLITFSFITAFGSVVSFTWSQKYLSFAALSMHFFRKERHTIPYQQNLFHQTKQ